MRNRSAMHTAVPSNCPSFTEGDAPLRSARRPVGPPARRPGRGSVGTAARAPAGVGDLLNSGALTPIQNPSSPHGSMDGSGSGGFEDLSGVVSGTTNASVLQELRQVREEHRAGRDEFLQVLRQEVREEYLDSRATAVQAQEELVRAVRGEAIVTRTELAAVADQILSAVREHQKMSGMETPPTPASGSSGPSFGLREPREQPEKRAPLTNRGTEGAAETNSFDHALQQWHQVMDEKFRSHVSSLERIGKGIDEKFGSLFASLERIVHRPVSPAPSRLGGIREMGRHAASQQQPLTNEPGTGSTDGQSNSYRNLHFNSEGSRKNQDRGPFKGRSLGASSDHSEVSLGGDQETTVQQSRTSPTDYLEIGAASEIRREVRTMEYRDDADFTFEQKEWQKSVLYGLTILPDCCFFRYLRAFVAIFFELQEPRRNGFFAELLLDRRFEGTCTLVIVGNAVFMGYLANWEMRHLGGTPPPPLITYAEIGFLSFYTVEISMKIVVHQWYFFCNHEWRWNVADALLVGVSIYDLAISPSADSGGAGNVTFMRMFRLLKLSKVVRLFRVLRFLRELRLLLVAMRRSFVSLFWCLVFLLFILYAFALVLLQGFSNLMADNMEDLDPILARNIEKRFRSMPVVMLSLYKATTGGADWGEYLDIVEVAGPIYGGLFVFYTAFFTFAVTNILTGMIVENVVKMAHGDDEAVLFTFRQQQHHAVVDVQRIFQQLDADGDGELNAEEFQRGMASDEVRALMSSVQLDVKDVEWFFKMLLETTGGSTLQIDAFVEACMKMKGNATSVDMQCIDFEVKLCRQGVSDLFLEVDAIAASVESSADRVLAEVGNRIEQALSQMTQLETSKSQARV